MLIAETIFYDLDHACAIIERGRHLQPAPPAFSDRIHHSNGHTTKLILNQGLRLSLNDQLGSRHTPGAYREQSIMIARSNLPRLREIAGAYTRVLDVGGWFHPFNLATHVLDLGSYETRHTAHALDPEDGERFTAATWIIHDACREPWPFPDKHFDFVVCSHLLEDVRDPLAVCREMCRVAKAGYVETPSRLREIFGKKHFFRLHAMLGGVPEVGFYHHRWFVEAEGAHLRFTAKTAALLEDPAYYLTRAHTGRALTEAESALALWWEGGFACEEAFVELRQDYRRFRSQALARFRTTP